VTGIYKCLLIISILLICILCPVLVSCLGRTNNMSDNTEDRPASPYIVNPPQLPGKPYPGLDIRTSEIVSAYENGGSAAATAYAKIHGIDLVDNMVGVIVEIETGNKDAAINAVNKTGAKDIIISSYNDLIGALVPLSQIKSLANSPAVKLIRQPTAMMPAN